MMPGLAIWVLVGVGLWLVASLLYLVALRRLLGTHEQRLVRALTLVADSLQAWEQALADFPQRERRESLTALAGIAQALASGGAIRERIEAARELRRLLPESAGTAAPETDGLAGSAAERALAVEHSLRVFESDFAHYRTMARFLSMRRW